LSHSSPPTECTGNAAGGVSVHGPFDLWPICG